MAQIDKPNLHFRTKLYLGTGSANSITYDESGNMQPDLMWIKSRGHTASWLCNDVLRGVTKRLKLDMNSAESTETQMITAFDTNGFSLGTSSTANQNTTDFASYSWKANGAGSSNSDGSTTDFWEMNQPHSVYLTMMAIGPWVKIQDTSKFPKVNAFEWAIVPTNYYVEKGYESFVKDILAILPK